MKRKSIYLYVFLVIALCFSCAKKTEKEIETDYISSLAKTLPLNNNIEWLVILPGLGCHGCIQEGEGFMKNNIRNKKILFALTRIESLKILQQKLGIAIKNFSNVYTDKDNRIKIPTNNSIYPCIVKITNGEVKEHEFQAPYNGDAFNKLKSLITRGRS